jgi:hypothetical protein
MGAVLIYYFSIHNTDGSDREIARRMALADDNAAPAFGKVMIRDMVRGDATRLGGPPGLRSAGFFRLLLFYRAEAGVLQFGCSSAVGVACSG